MNYDTNRPIMQVTTTKTLNVAPGDLTAGILADFLADVPETAKVTVRTSYPDRPGEIGRVTLTVTL